MNIKVNIVKLSIKFKIILWTGFEEKPESERTGVDAWR